MLSIFHHPPFLAPSKPSLSTPTYNAQTSSVLRGFWVRSRRCQRDARRTHDARARDVFATVQRLVFLPHPPPKTPPESFEILLKTPLCSRGVPR